VPSRKQRRKQQKARRHEYEYVYVDEEGKEVEVDPAELRDDKASRSPNGKARSTPARGRQGRVVPPPSWARVGRRALIFAPIMFLFVSLLGGHGGARLTLQERLFQTLVLVALFVPFGYFTERIAYRAYLRRSGQSAPPR
jgi:hypothetical protein